jgi:hypothetical protein
VGTPQRLPLIEGDAPDRRAHYLCAVESRSMWAETSFTPAFRICRHKPRIGSRSFGGCSRHASGPQMARQPTAPAARHSHSAQRFLSSLVA